MARSLRRLCTAHPRHLVVDDDTVKVLACADELERLGAVLDLLVSDTDQIERLQRQRKADERIIFDVKRTVVVGEALLDDWRLGAQRSRILKTRINDAVDLAGYAHREARALAVALGAQHERAVVLAQELADYWQPETCATVTLHLPAAHLSKHQVLAERAELALAEPDPLVLDRHGQLRPARPLLDEFNGRPQPDRLAPLGKVDRVGHSVLHALLEPQPIGDKHSPRRQSLGSGSVELNAFQVGSA
mmetsp:Transcript_38054/g.94128  ORF Transcript_38054/g.94128 Transcript_38054/m.94128 type:complete len:247 (-) Transcript_38054:1897-2637(-)